MAGRPSRSCVTHLHSCQSRAPQGGVLRFACSGEMTMSDAIHRYTRQFCEPDTEEECFVIVRSFPGTVYLCLSRRTDGDVEMLARFELVG